MIEIVIGGYICLVGEVLGSFLEGGLNSLSSTHIPIIKNLH